MIRSLTDLLTHECFTLLYRKERWLYTVGLFFFCVGLSGQFAPQCSVSDLNDSTIVINDFDTISLRILVSEADEVDLLNSFQSVCAVRIDFEHQQLSDLTIALTSPSGRTVTMIGGALPNGTNFSVFPIEHDLIFLPNLTGSVNPDPDLQSPWSNNLPNWGNSSSYGGRYHPFDGDFGGELDTGLVTGVWELTIIDHFLNGQGEFNGWDIEFCVDDGLVCGPCESFAGSFSNQDTIQLCEGLNTSILQYFIPGPSDSTLYQDQFLIYDTMGVLQMSGLEPDLSTLTEGFYNIHAFNIDDYQFSSSISEIETWSRQQLLDSVSAIGGRFCMDVNTNPIVLNVRNAGSTVVNLSATSSDFNCDFMTISLDHDATFSFDSVDWFLDDVLQSQFDGMMQIDVNDPGLYRVEVSNTFGCIISDSISLGVNFDIPSGVIDAPILTCNSGNITATYTSGNQIRDNIWIDQSSTDTIGRNPTVQIGNPGLYNLLLISENGCDTLIPFEVEADVDLISVTNIPVGQQILNCSDTVLAVNPDRDASNIAREYWIQNNLDTLFIPSETSLALDLKEAGTFEYVVEANNGCVTNSGIIEIVIDTLHPDYEVQFDTITCYQPFANVMLSGLDRESVIWSNPLQPVSDSSAIVNVDGVVYFSVIDDQTSCEVLDSIVITRNETVPNVVISGDTSLSCERTSVELSASFNGVLIDSIRWQDAQGNIFNSPSVSITESGPLTVQVTGQNGCTYDETIDILDNSDAPDISVQDMVRVSCAEPSFSLSISDLTDIDSVFWIFGIDTVGGPSITYEPIQSSFEVIAVGDNGCPRLQVINVNYDTITPQFGLIADTITCSQETVTISTDVNFDHHTFVWAGNGVDGITTPDVAVNVAGAYALNVTDTLNGCFDLTPINVISNLTLPSISFEPVDTITCLNETVTLALTTEEQNEISWTTSQGQVINQNMININDAGFQYALVTGPNGCETVDSIEVFSNTVEPRVDIANTYSITCENRTDTLSPNFIDPYTSISWFFKNGTITDNTIEEITEDDIVETLTVTGLNGCQTTVDFNISIATEVPMAIINTQDTVVCDGQGIMIHTNPVVDPTHVITWTDVNSVLAINQEFLNIDSTGTFFLEVRNSNSGCFATDTVSVILSPSPLESLIIDYADESCLGDQLGYIHVTGSNGGFGPVDVIIDGLSTGFSPLEPLDPGIYDIVARDVFGCSLDTTISILAGESLSVELGPDRSVERGNPVVIIPNYMGDPVVDVIWTSNGDTISNNMDSLALNAFEDQLIVIEAISGNGCRAFDSIFIDVFVDINTISLFVPNILHANSSLGNDFLTLTIPPDIVEVGDFSIYDRWGQRVAYISRMNSGETLTVWEGDFNGQNVASGVYVYTYDMLTIYGPARRVVSGDITVIH